MKKLYEKNELIFALVWIAIYVAGTSLAEALSETIGAYKLVSAVFHIALTAGLFPSGKPSICCWLKERSS